MRFFNTQTILAALDATKPSRSTDQGKALYLPPSHPLQDILAQSFTGPLYTYPTSLTQDIIPKGIHSHNDYWRPIPFYSALSVGAISIEADVWLVNDTLLVGHAPSALTSTRTFDALYIQPLLDVLRRQNPPLAPAFGNPETHLANGLKNGVYDVNPGQTLYLFVDVKTSAEATWAAVRNALAPLREQGMLTTTVITDDDNEVMKLNLGAVTVVGTGNAPLRTIERGSGKACRDAFYDAPLAQLQEAAFANLSSAVAPIASTSFRSVFGDVRAAAGLNEEQIVILRQQIAVAHERGMMVRYWDQPAWPVATRNAIWRVLWDEGVDLLSVDELDQAAGVWAGGY